MLGEDGEGELERLRRQGVSEPELELMAAGAFNRKPILVRLAVLLAGVTMNFVLAAVLFSAWALLPPQVPVGPIAVEAVEPGSPAAQVGLLPGDLIVSVDGRTFRRSSDLAAYLAAHGGQEVELGIRRGGEELVLAVTPRPVAERAPGEGAVGFRWNATATIDDEPETRNVLTALALGVEDTVVIAYQLPGALLDAVAGLLGLAPNTDQARGPIGIAEVTGQVIESGARATIGFVGLLSVNLAVLNVLPFPPLDGGRIVVTLLEGVRRRRLPAQSEALIYLTGFLVLITLVILISIQDVARIFGG
jgi:regulator of sigma E protease